jgi:homoserine dehydrogenase
MPKYLDWGPGGADVVASVDDVATPWYVRADAPAEALRAAFDEVTFLARAGAPDGEAAILTPSMTRSQLEEKLSGLSLKSVFRVLAE